MLFPNFAWTTSIYASVHQTPHWRVHEANESATAAASSDAELDVMVAYCAGILRPVLLDMAGVVFLNAHDGRVPRYRGMHCCLWAIYNADPVYGTVHRMTRGLDAGDVLVEQPLALGRPRTIDEFFKVAYSTPWSLLSAAVEGLDGERLRFMKQSGPATQWFSMHPRLREVVQAKLDDGSFFARQERSLAEQPGPERSVEPSGWWTALLRRAANPPVPGSSAVTAEPRRRCAGGFGCGPSSCQSLPRRMARRRRISM